MAEIITNITNRDLGGNAGAGGGPGSLSGLTALVTGSSRGIGLAIAERLAKAGCGVIMTCRRDAEALFSEAGRLSRTYGAPCRAAVCDASSYEETEALFRSIGRLDILVNNAGIAGTGLLQDMTPEAWRRVMATDLDSVFYTCRLAIPLFLRQGSGRILNISSVWGCVGGAMECAYSAAKGGVNALTRALARELAPSQIPVNAIAFGFIDTEMNSMYTPEEREAIREQIPADRFAAAGEAADAAMAVLCSPAYLTGQVITFDGGWT